MGYAITIDGLWCCRDVEPRDSSVADGRPRAAAAATRHLTNSLDRRDLSRRRLDRAQAWVPSARGSTSAIAP